MTTSPTHLNRDKMFHIPTRLNQSLEQGKVANLMGLMQLGTKSRSKRHDD